MRNPQQQLRACYRMIAKMPTLAAMAYKTSIGQPIIYPRNDLTYAENFLHMMFAGGWAGQGCGAQAARAGWAVGWTGAGGRAGAWEMGAWAAGAAHAPPLCHHELCW